MMSEVMSEVMSEERIECCQRRENSDVRGENRVLSEERIEYKGLCRYRKDANSGKIMTTA